ncbi:uncharacterized protein BP5553_01488 [Venustampulla echinocandica]|uniref:Uncharacterized protein n=1 Tax=Venustampulla echinocandica TaxID=2656787 RepID=A0A370U156_9HELO|nr:uncharacterized protein BP5553_01488 [Venustampulla echinocandica]RDL41509.1 hypothetical protein BP5553_01488 [Venustampulla echinocandica]
MARRLPGAKMCSRTIQQAPETVHQRQSTTNTPPHMRRVPADLPVHLREADVFSKARVFRIRRLLPRHDILRQPSVQSGRRPGLRFSHKPTKPEDIILCDRCSALGGAQDIPRWLPQRGGAVAEFENHRVGPAAGLR